MKEIIFMCRNKKPKFHRLCTYLFKTIWYFRKYKLIILITSEMNEEYLHFLKLFSIREFNHMIKN